tara:strand:- start:984 stop:5651 length:4668 start_codon:yes stop_codon:yes gene_type:complete
MNRDNFLKNIRTKYPQYNDIGDDALVELIIKKYPQYKSQVDLKKKDLTSESPSLEGSTELIEEVEEKVKKSPRDIFLDKTFNEIKSNISKRIQNDPEIIDLYNLSIENTRSVADVFVNQYESLSNINVESEDDLFRVSEEINNDFSFIAKKNLADNTRYNQILSKYNQEGIRLFTDAVQNYDETQAKLTRFTDVQRDFSKFGLSGNLFQGEGFFPAMYDAFKYSMPMSKKSYRALSNSKQIKDLNREKRNLLKKDPNDVFTRMKKNTMSQFDMGETITVEQRIAEINKAIPALKKEAVINMSEATGISKFLGNLDESTHFVDDVSFKQFKKILGQSLPNMVYAVVQPMMGSAILEGGGLYMDALNEKAIEKFGDDYTQEEMLSLIGSGEDDTETILGASSMMASLDLLGAGKIVNLTSKVIKNIAKDTIKKTGKNIGKKGFVFNTLQNGFKGFATEFITGGGQNVIGQFAIDRITTEDKTIDFSEVFKSAVDEGVGGGGVVVLTGSVGGGLNYTLNKFSKKNLDKMFTINGQDIPRADFIKKLKSVTSLSELKNYNVLNDKRAEEILNKKKSELSATDTPIESSLDNYESAFTTPVDNEGKPKTYLESFKDRVKKAIGLVESAFDRQSNIRRILTSENFINTRAYMTNMAGMMAYGGDVAYKLNQKIFNLPNNIKKNGVVALNDIITLKRIIQLDSKRDSKNLERIKHPDGYNLESATKKLKELRKNLGRKTYKDLDARADNYSGVFNKMLEEKKDAGLITEETYNELKDDFYSPRRFLEKTLEDNDVNFLSSSFNFQKSELNNIRMGSEGALNYDFETLLAIAQTTHIKRMHANKMSKSLYQETTNKIKETGQGFSWFKELKKKRKKKGEKFVTEYEEAPVGFTTMSFKENGKVVKYAIEKDLATEFTDDIQINSDIGRAAGTYLGSNVLRAFATGYNPAFAAVNVPMDITNQLFFTDIHDDANIFVAGARLTYRAGKMAKNIISDKTGMKFKNKEFNELLEAYTRNGGLMQMYAGQTKGVDSKLETPTGKDTLIDKAKRSLSFAGEVSELAVRLAGFEQARINIKKNNPNLSQEEIDIRAVEKTRQALEFNMGAATVKKFDQAIPYLNVGFQALRTAGAYIRNNPLNFSKKLLYGNLGLTAVYASQFLNYNEEDQEDWDKIPDYIKNNNLVILLDDYETIEKNGVEHKVRKYAKIRLAPQVANFITQPSILLAESLAHNINGGKSEPSTFEVSATTTSRYRQFLNFGADFLKGFSPVSGIPLPPVLRGGLETFTNYDFFRDRPIETQSDANVSPSRRGVDRSDIPSFYKTFAEVSGISAPKTKHFIESVITSDRNNFIIPTMYIMGEHVNNMIRNVDDSDVSFAYKSKYADKNVLNPFESLFGTQKIISTVPVIDYGDENINEIIEKANYRDGDFRQKLKILIQKNPDIDDSEKKFRQVIDSQNFTEKQKRQAYDFYKYNYQSTKIKNPDNIEIGLRIKYEDNAFARSVLFLKYFGELDKKEKLEVLSDFKLMRVPNILDIAEKNIVDLEEFKDDIEELRSYEATSILEPLEQ